MKQLDVYYRALLNYRSQTLENRDCAAQRNAITKGNTESDRIVLTRKICTVQEDWVDAIEKGLEFIEKAIKEDRQFIRSNGEVVPIEKVKNVSKDSVSHLARHSNLITRQTDSADIIPDQLYTVEKLNDYAVYENRFLYMLLCYLRDFITLRYNNILELSNTYNGTMTMNKVAKLSKQTIRYEVKLAEERKDDKYLREHNEAKEIIDRIDLLLKAVLAFLSTPLMEFVSKAPMLKPPITKTNVLKMNNNFKQAMALYSYVVSYEGDGYTVETQIKEMNPFREDVADEMAETILLSSFLTYEHNLGIESMLKQSYDREEKRRKEEEYLKFLEKLEFVRRRVEKSGETPEEYILMLEKKIRHLEKRCEELDQTKQELLETKRLLEESRQQASELTETLARTCEELEAEKQRYINDMAALKALHEEEVCALQEAHEQELRNLQESHEAEIRGLCEAHASEINTLNEAHAAEVASIREQHAEELERKNGFIEELKAQNASDREAYRAELSRLTAEHQSTVDGLEAANKALLEQQEELIKEKRLLNARLLALRKEKGLLTAEDEYTSQERFTELEHTFNLFKQFYKDEWNRTKKKIRKELLKPEKAEKAEKPEKKQTSQHDGKGGDEES